MRKFVVTVLFASLAMSAFAGDKEVEDLLSKMRKAYKEVKTAKFEVVSTLQGENGDFVVRMKGSYKSPNKMHVNVDVNDVNLKIISNGKRLFAVNDLNDQVADVPYSNDNMGRALNNWVNLEIINFYEWKKQLSTAAGDNMNGSKLSIRQNEEWNGKKWIVLEESAPQVDVYVEYYVDPKTHLIWRTVQMTIDKEFTRGDFVVTKLSLGDKIDDKLFDKPIIT